MGGTSQEGTYVSRVIPYSESVSWDYLGWDEGGEPVSETLPELLSLYHCEKQLGRQLTSWLLGQRRRVRLHTRGQDRGNAALFDGVSHYVSQFGLSTNRIAGIEFWINNKTWTTRS